MSRKGFMFQMKSKKVWICSGQGYGSEDIGYTIISYFINLSS